MLEYAIRFISDFKDILDYLISSKFSRLFYLYKTSWIFYYTMLVGFQAIKFKAKTE